MQIILNDLYHKSVRELMDEGYQVTIALEPSIPGELKTLEGNPPYSYKVIKYP